MEVFSVGKWPKAHIQVVHVPQYITYTNVPLGFTSEQMARSSTLILRRIVPQVSHH